MILEMLISCMHQKNTSIIEKSGIHTDALIINQCDRNDYEQFTTDVQNVRMISTTERGLSNSRNMAMEHAQGDICLFCDNDEVFYPNYESIILNAFHRIPEADIILFAFDGVSLKFKNKEYRLNYFDLFHASSWQIAYRKSSLERKKVRFDPYMGAGSGNGAQEENKFLMDCYRKKLRIYYVPQKIGRLIENESTWFAGYDENFFYQRGASSRRLLGFGGAVLYVFYYTIRKQDMYRKEISLKKALSAALKGCLENPIRKQVITDQKIALKK